MHDLIEREELILMIGKYYSVISILMRRIFFWAAMNMQLRQAAYV